VAKSKLRLFLAVGVLAISVGLLVWSLTPSVRVDWVVPILPFTTTSLQPAVPESRYLTLEWPSAMRVGDADVVRLTLEVDAGGNLTAAAETGGQQAHGGVIQLPDVYDTHNVVAEARLDMAGVQVKPPETVSEPLSAGRSVTFYWSVSPPRAGVYPGTVWFYLHFIPRKGGVESRQAVSAQRIEIRAVTLFGLAAAPARMIGGLGSLISAILGFPFVEDIFRWLCYKRKA